MPRSWCVQAKGIADGVDLLADNEVGRVRQRDGLQVGRADLQQCQIVDLVLTYDGGFIGMLVAGLDFDPIGVGNDVEVGENVASLVENEAGALPSCGTWP